MPICTAYNKKSFEMRGKSYKLLNFCCYLCKVSITVDVSRTLINTSCGLAVNVKLAYVEIMKFCQSNMDQFKITSTKVKGNSNVCWARHHYASLLSMQRLFFISVHAYTQVSRCFCGLHYFEHNFKVKRNLKRILFMQALTDLHSLFLF